MIGGQGHTVRLIWSKKTGKQVVEMDDKEEWFGRQKGASIVSHKWETGGIRYHVLATRATPNNAKKSVPEFRKYELLINGQSFSSLPMQDGTLPSTQEPSTDGETTTPHSILDILYPDGYDPDAFRPEETDTPGSTADEYQQNERLRQRVTARRIVRHDGTPR